MPAVDIEPGHHNSKAKNDIIAWEGIPKYTCDLNFRPLQETGVGDLATAVRYMIVASAAAVIVRLVLSLTIADIVFAKVSFGGVVIASAAAFALPLYGDHSLRRRALVPILIVGLWLMLGNIVVSSGTLVEAIISLIAGAACTAFLADVVATNYVHWTSAHPCIKRETMTAWRSDWKCRWGSIPDRPASQVLSDQEKRRNYADAMQLRRTFRWTTGLAVLVPVVALFIVVFLSGLRPVVPESVVLLVITNFIYAALAAGYCVMWPESLSVFTKAMGIFFVMGINPQELPYVWQSPVGNRISRRTLLICISVAFTFAYAAVIRVAAHYIIDASSAEAVLYASLAYWIAIPIFAPPLILLLSVFVAAAPALVGHYRGLEMANAPEQTPGYSSFDGYVTRIQKSRNKYERRCNIVGVHSEYGFPILADTDLDFEHQLIVGPTGGGKTALSVNTDLIQNIRRNDGLDVVIDGKGDRNLFQTALVESKAAGRKLKWWTNKPHLSTYLFNPIAHLQSDQFTLPEVLGVLLQSLNLFHGTEYARAFFGHSDRALLRAALRATMQQKNKQRGGPPQAKPHNVDRIQSFWDLDDALREMAANRREFESAKHLLMMVQSLCDFDNLNITSSRSPNESAIQHAISLPQAIEEKQVLYFYLVGSLDAASVSEVARLVLFATNAAAVNHRDRTGERPRIHFLIDEAQCIFTKNFEIVLQQARDTGIALTLAHQSLSQLKLPGGADLTQQVLNSTGIKRIHAARDPGFQQYIADVSGTTTYYTRNWKQLKRRVHNGEVGARYACTDADGVMRIDVSEQLGPRLETEDIRDINRDINRSVAIFERNSGYTQFKGAFPLTTQWPMSKSEYDARSKALWPTAEGETITIEGAWPKDHAQETVVANPPATLGAEADPKKLDDTLRALQELLRSEPARSAKPDGAN